MANPFSKPAGKTFYIFILSILVIISGSAAISGQSLESIQSLISALPATMGNVINYSRPLYDDFELAEFPVLSEFVTRYDTLEDLLRNMENDFGLVYDLSGDQMYYGQMSFNESPLTLLDKVEKGLDNTYQCFERAELVALWAEQKFGYPPLILSFFTNDPENIRMNHSTYVYEVNGKWGYMSDNRDFISPKYDTVEELAAEWMAFHGSPLDDCDDHYVQWLLVDLRNIFNSRGDWRTTDQNIRLYMKDVVKSGIAVSPDE